MMELIPKNAAGSGNFRTTRAFSTMHFDVIDVNMIQIPAESILKPKKPARTIYGLSIVMYTR